MVFSKYTSLHFTGLRKIQYELERIFSQNGTYDDVLFVTASLPSLEKSEKNQLVSLLKNYQRIFFWCYGDLLWNKKFWLEIEDELKGKEVVWVVASSAWKKIASSFIPEHCLQVVPHPVKLEHTTSDRTSLREKFGFKSDEKVLVYAGRRSLQKNMLELFQVWGRLRSIVPGLKFVLAGEWCDYGNPFFSERHRDLDKEKSAWEKLMIMFPDEVIDLGQLSSAETSDLLLSGDVVLSMSTFTEEDFGLAVREAHHLGTPVVITNWGGHIDLKGDGVHHIQLTADYLPNIEHAVHLASRALQEGRGHLYLPTELNMDEVIKFQIFDGFYKGTELSLEKIQRIMSGLDDL